MFCGAGLTWLAMTATLFIIYSFVLTSENMFSNIKLSSYESLRFDLQEPFIESIYTVGEKQSCNAEEDKLMHYPWFGGTIVCESQYGEINKNTCYSEYDDDEESEVSYTKDPSFPMIQ